jgi:hypothetical protein
MSNFRDENREYESITEFSFNFLGVDNKFSLILTLWTSCDETREGNPVLGTINGTQWKIKPSVNLNSGKTVMVRKLTPNITC